MREVFGVLITWTTYGTWLPGDARGWRAKRLGNQPADPKLEAEAREKMKFDPVTLSAADRATVEAACREHCDHRGWRLHAVNARTNHVHVVVVSGGRQAADAPRPTQGKLYEQTAAAGKNPEL